ncbi:MAG TPA: EpsI family protein [Gemmatimonadales bacterium]|nr:EpsI family protein [Gemmatimonadales bacterium]
MLNWHRYVPAGLLGIGCLMLLSVQSQRSMALQAPLTGVPAPIDGLRAEDLVVPDDQVQVAGMTSYVNRVFYRDTIPAYSMYVGFYDSQSQGKTVHSPKNCLPGAGWEAMDAGTVKLAASNGKEATVNRYLIANGNMQALVYYWYQGRGRVAHNEYLVKWDLLRDAALERRTDEALVRLVVPVVAPAAASHEQLQAAQAVAEEIAREAATQLVVSLEEFLPS